MTLVPQRAARPGRRRLWIHAVSVGETLSVAALAQRIRSRDPSLEIVLSTVTVTGQEAAARVLGAGVDGRFYFPFDIPLICRRFLERVRPDAVALIETEIWPNFLAECVRRGIPAVLLNARMSERSFRRYLRLRPLFGAVLRCFSAIAAQTEEDARRFVAVGADPASVIVAGNMKFDVAPPPKQSLALCLRLLAAKEGGDSWFVAGSTHRGEEDAVLDAFDAARLAVPGLRLLLAPRHPERFDEVEHLCTRRGWTVARRSGLAGGAGEAPVVLLDTVGELLGAYAAADIAFVGGSLAPHGGHNILEPALFGVPVVVGPHTWNFREIVSIFVREGAVAVASEGKDLARLLGEWARERDRFQSMGRRGRELLEGFRGAAERGAGIVLEAVGRGTGGR